MQITLTKLLEMFWNDWVKTGLNEMSILWFSPIIIIFFITVAQPVNITNKSDDWKHYNQQHFQREL